MNWISDLHDRERIQHVPIKWKEMVYTTDHFRDWATGPAFNGWAGEMQDDMKEADTVVRQLGLQPGDSILDIACGYGRISTLLASEHALQVSGIDISPGLIEVAERNAVQKDLAIEYVLGDPVDAAWQSEFDSACILFNSFSLFSPDDAPLVLRNAGSALSGSGKIFIDIDNKEYCYKYGVYDTNWHSGPDRLSLQEVYFNQETSIETCRDISFDFHGGTVDESTTFKRIYSFEEIEELLAVSGFRIERAFGTWDLKPITVDSPKIIIIACKIA